jgi:hypothetical protein
MHEKPAAHTSLLLFSKSLFMISIINIFYAAASLTAPTVGHNEGAT